MFINFKKYDWEECIRRLMVEVKNAYGEANSHEREPKLTDKENSTSTHSKTEETKNIRDEFKETSENVNENQQLHSNSLARLSKEKTKKILKWTENDALNWFNEKKFSPNLVENLKPNVNGKILFQMYHILLNTPEFFYTSLRTDSNNKLLLKDIALFSFELSALFEENYF